MANQLDLDKKTAAVAMLCEGNSIRSIERMTGVHRDTNHKFQPFDGITKPPLWF